MKMLLFDKETIQNILVLKRCLVCGLGAGTRRRAAVLSRGTWRFLKQNKKTRLVHFYDPHIVRAI